MVHFIMDHKHKAITPLAATRIHHACFLSELNKGVSTLKEPCPHSGALLSFPGPPQPPPPPNTDTGISPYVGIRCDLNPFV